MPGNRLECQRHSVLDPRTNESELIVQKIINLPNVANNLPDAFTDYKGVSKSHVPAMNVPERVEISHKTTQPPKRGGGNLDTRGQDFMESSKGNEESSNSKCRSTSC